MDTECLFYYPPFKGGLRGLNFPQIKKAGNILNSPALLTSPVQNHKSLYDFEKRGRMFFYSAR